MAAGASYSYAPWKDTPGSNDLNISGDNRKKRNINIGLVGDAQSGKSSFVNAIFGASHKKATEKENVAAGPTTEATCYSHPDNSNIKLWDLPGLGNVLYPETKTYYRGLNLASYDAFLLFTRGPLTVNSKRLATRFHYTRKAFLLVRTCIDMDVDNEKNTKRKTFNESKMIDEIRQSILEGLKDLDTVSGEQIFLISNIYPNKWNFKQLSDWEMLQNLGTPMVTCLPVPRISEAFLLAKLSFIEKHEKFKAENDEGTLLKFLKENMPGLKKDFEENGIKASLERMEEELDQWKETKINLAFVGDTCIGKSSLINAIRGVEDSDPNDAAETGINETTKTPEAYFFKNNKSIALWDCPGIGSASFPGVDKYCKSIKYEMYDAFIIMTAYMFSDNIGNLASKLKSIKKPFFLVRTKIDLACADEKRKNKLNFNEAKLLETCKESCLKELKRKNVSFDNDDIFLISSHHRYQWDLPRLTEAIKNRLPPLKRESFLFSMLTLSENIVNDKVESLKGRVKFVAFFQSNIIKPFTTREFSRKIDFKTIVKKVKFYRSQLGFPDRCSEEFKTMGKALQDEVHQFYVTNKILLDTHFVDEKNDGGDECTGPANEGSSLYDDSDTEPDDEDIKYGEKEEFPPWLDINLAIDKPYKFVSSSLHSVLDSMKEAALKILKETAARSEPDLEID